MSTIAFWVGVWFLVLAGLVGAVALDGWWQCRRGRHHWAWEGGMWLCARCRRPDTRAHSEVTR